MRRILHTIQKFIQTKPIQHHKPLGRWNISYCDNTINRRIDLSNEDHCGVCNETSVLHPTISTKKNELKH